MASVVVSSQILGGFIAGAGGGVQLIGMYDRFQYQQLPQFGFDGILIAILAKQNPKYVPLTGFFWLISEQGLKSCQERRMFHTKLFRWSRR